MRIRDIIAERQGIEGLDVLNILAHTLSVGKEQVLTHLDSEIDEESGIRIQEYILARKQGKPLSYITKTKEFFSEPFYVDERVLIPRPETEILVEEALRLLQRMPDAEAVLDMGTGSGVIGLVIAKKTGKRVVCVDNSLGALTVARKNGEALGLLHRVDCLCSNLFGGIKQEKGFDMILANLPYVAGDEWEAIMADVKNYEPRNALYGGEDGMTVYRRLIEDLPRHLRKGGYMLCEVGGKGQAEKVKEMLQEAGLCVGIKRDLSRKERVLVGSWTSLS